MTQSELFRQIEMLVPSLGGWCSVERASELANAILTLRPVTSISIGIWAGRDTLSMGLAHKFLKFGKVLAIDPYSAEASVDGETEANRAWWGSQESHDLVCAGFEQAIQDLGLASFIDFQRKRSDEVQAPFGASVICLDGNHSDQAVRDVDRFIAPMPVGSIAYLDDEHWSTGGVKKAVARLEELGFERHFNRDTGAFFTKMRV